MKYKLVASDFDGTMYDHTSPYIPEENKKAVREYIEAGGRFILATGRMYRSIRPYALELGLNGEIIAYQGASIYDIETSKLLMNIPMTCEETVQILKYIESKNAHCQIYYNDIYYIREMNDYAESYSAYCGIPVNLTHMPLSEYVEKGRLEPTKIMVIMPPDSIVSFHEDIMNKYKCYNYARSSEKFLEITSLQANKGVALDYLSKIYGIGRENMLAIGDSTNDIAMIKYAGCGVAVGNAMDELKAEADYITIPAKDNAVAEILRKVMRDEI